VNIDVSDGALLIMVGPRPLAVVNRVRMIVGLEGHPTAVKNLFCPSSAEKRVNGQGTA